MAHSPYPVYLWRVAISYRGYLIVPVQGRNDQEVVGCTVAVFDPFGSQLAPLEAFGAIPQFENFWKDGQTQIDEDIQVFMAEDFTPTQRAIFQEIGAIES